MAKLKNSSSRGKNGKLPDLTTQSLSAGNTPKAAVPRDSGNQAISSTRAGSVVQALKFGTVHTKPTGSAGSSTWGSLLSSATSGGVSGALGGGLLSGGTFGFIGKLFDLFGGGKSTPTAPTPFVLPESQVASLNIGLQGSSSSIVLGVQGSSGVQSHTGPVYQQTGGPASDHAAQSAHVVQIVKQALLTSSSLNDVISEI